MSEEIVAPQPDPERKSLKPADAVRSLADLGHLKDQTLVAVSEGLECYQSVAHRERNVCPVAHGTPGRERDFTTQGTQGPLRCPFGNKPENVDGVEDALETNGDTCGHEDLDPIKGESNDKRSTTSSARHSAARCPIRFLNQHSPEEVADYVERHKHEIPRSHAVCVQRYQKDSRAMRQMDSKYGGVTNMIQGLGAKHQSFLPNRGHNSGQNSISNGGVEKWAADVDAKSMQAITEEEDDERKGHFDRPLREVRVGESPSRPWGIPVPAEPAFAPHSPTAPVPVSNEVDANNVDTSSAKPFRNASHPGGCPFGQGNHGVNGPDAETIRNEDEEEKPKEPTDLEGKSGSVVFNGPVFFGYTAEQTAGLMQQLGRPGK